MQLKHIDPETGEAFILDRTLELSRNLQAHWEAECKHLDTKIVTIVVSGGGKQVRSQCQICGQYQGNPLKHSDFNELPPSSDKTIAEKYEKERNAKLELIYQYHIKKQKRERSGYRDKYAAYLLSDAWHLKRDKVFKRAKGLCEGCLEVAPSEVHHLSYVHVFDELLFELAALCEDCHRKAHRWEPVTESEYESMACFGCRWGSWEGQAGWCSLFEVTSGVALAKDGPCGPENKALEPLR